MTNSTHIAGFGINVDDLDRSVEFYTQVLGLQEKTKIDLGDLHEVLVGGDGDAARILLVKHADRADAPEPGSGFEKIVLATGDVDALHEQVVANGGTSVEDPHGVAEHNVRVAMVRDPDGYLLELVQYQA